MGMQEGKRTSKLDIEGFQQKVKLYYETEKYLCTKHKKKEYFNNRWKINFT